MRVRVRVRVRARVRVRVRIRVRVRVRIRVRVRARVRARVRVGVRVRGHLLAVARHHAEGGAGLDAVVELPRDGADVVGELGEVLLHRGRVAPLGEDVDEVGGGHEVEARELLALGLEEVREALLAEVELLLAPLHGLASLLLQARLEGRRRAPGWGYG